MMISCIFLASAPGTNFGTSLMQLSITDSQQIISTTLDRAFAQTRRPRSATQGNILDIVEREYHRPLSFLMKSILRAFRKGPIAASYIVLINLLLTPFYSLIVRRYKLSWFTASSTK